jgi:hypothetical protein
MHNGSAPDGNALTARGRLTIRELLASETLVEASRKAARMAADAANWWEVSDMLGHMDAIELIPNRTQFDDAPSLVSKKRIADLLIIRWKGRQDRRAMDAARESAREGYMAHMRKCGMSASKAQLRQIDLYLQSKFEIPAI